MVKHSSENLLRRSLLLKELILTSLDSHKAIDVEVIDLNGKTDVADFMVVASGTSSRHIGALAGHVADAIRDTGFSDANIEGGEDSDWVVIDNPYVVVHLFKPETRSHYQLEKMWQTDFAERERVHVY